MFTGIVEGTAAVSGISDGPGFRRLTVLNHLQELKIGQSIAVNGCCLTVTHFSAQEIGFDAVKETLDKTNLGLLKIGDRVNVERSLRVGERLDGHFVQGHVDGRGELIDVTSEGNDRRLKIEAPLNIAKYIVSKGSITLDGVSLTVAAVRGTEFEVALIPETLRVTTLGEKTVGWPFNLEADILSKTVIGWLERQQVGRGG